MNLMANDEMTAATIAGSTLARQRWVINTEWHSAVSKIVRFSPQQKQYEGNRN
jgi:hypothetical protein